MGTLKRFSYDNIVIHDPTAPDPVDYDGGGEGGGSGGGGSVMYITADPPLPNNPFITASKTFAEVKEAINNGIVPVFALATTSEGSTTYHTVCHLLSVASNSIHFTSTRVRINAITEERYIETTDIKMLTNETRVDIVRYPGE